MEVGLGCDCLVTVTSGGRGSALLLPLALERFLLERLLGHGGQVGLGPGRVMVVVWVICIMFAVQVSFLVTSGGAGSKTTVVRVIVTLVVTVFVGMISKRHCKSSAWDKDVNAIDN